MSKEEKARKAAFHEKWDKMAEETASKQQLHYEDVLYDGLFRFDLVYQ